jgi:hypothetical protein
MQENTRFVHTLFASLSFIATLNNLSTISAYGGTFKMCIALMRVLYPLCSKGNRYKHKTVLMLAKFTHPKMYLLTSNSTQLTFPFSTA